MARFTDLTDEELQKKAEDHGVEDAGAMSRAELEAAILERDPHANDEPEDTSMADKGAFVTPIAEQGEEPSAADEREERPHNVETPSHEEADQSSLGGTGGTTGLTGGEADNA